MATRLVDCLPRDIGFLLIPGFSMLALCSALEPLRLANQLLGQRYYTWRVFTSDGQPALSSCGMTVAACSRVSPNIDRDAPACLFVIAGFDPWPQPERHLKSWLRSLDRRGALLGTVDTGAFLLAAAELLDETPTVLHWESAAAFSELFPNASISEKLFDIEGRRLLCAGGAAVLGMMIALIERSHGPELAAGIAERLIYDRNRAPAHEQRPLLRDRMRLSDRDVLRAMRAMEEQIETTCSISQIASAANVSKRTLERKFRQFLDKTPKQVYLECRLDHARRLLRHSDLTVREIAVASGFSSISYFCRAYKRRFRVKPGSDRRLDYSLVESGTRSESTIRVN
jgi:transcriptional regulator GlxA family with amidase domain